MIVGLFLCLVIVVGNLVFFFIFVNFIGVFWLFEGLELVGSMWVGYLVIVVVVDVSVMFFGYFFLEKVV